MTTQPEARVTDCTSEDMTLRDYFAAKAMQSLLLVDEMIFENIELRATEAYRMADAMLQERTK